MVKNYYSIVSITDKESGEFTERHFRRKGHKINLTLCSLGLPILWEYLDGSGSLRTSKAISIEEDIDLNIDVNTLTVKTMNTIYIFKKEEVDNG